MLTDAAKTSKHADRQGLEGIRATYRQDKGSLGVKRPVASPILGRSRPVAMRIGLANLRLKTASLARSGKPLDSDNRVLGTRGPCSWQDPAFSTETAIV